MTLGPREGTLSLREGTLGSKEGILGPREVTLGLREGTLGPREVTWGLMLVTFGPAITDLHQTPSDIQGALISQWRPLVSHFGLGEVFSGYQFVT